MRASEHYRLPLQTPERREASHVFAREIMGSGAFLRAVARGLITLEDLPTLLVWGDADAAFGTRELERFERIFPDHTTVILRGAGRYVQEEAPEQIAAAIRDSRPTES